MKTVVADYKFKIYCLRIVPLWGPVVYLTTHVRNVTMNGHTYLTGSGYEFSGQAAETKMAPGVADLTGIADIAGIGYDQVVSGVFDNARIYCFATSWFISIEDEEPLAAAFMGKTKLKDKRYTAEVMSMIDVLNQASGRTYTASCQKHFGGQEYAGCLVDLGPLTVTGTITSVASNSVFSDSARTEVEDYFGEGVIAFTSGANAGLKQEEIKFFRGVNTGIITAITKAAQAEITIGAHSFPVNADVTIANVSGMTQINGLTAAITAISATTVTVAINSTAFSTYTSGGSIDAIPGVITVHEAFHYPVAVGDAYTLIPGCRKRLVDCRDKWSNVINFGGFPNIPTTSQYLTRGLGH